MKKSNYNVYVPMESGNTLVFNTITQGIMELESDYINKLNYPESFSEDEVKLLSDHGMLTVGNKQENLIFDSYEHLKRDTKTMYLTITLTNVCNFKCVYCYQDREVKRIDKDKSDEILKFIEEKISNGVENLLIHLKNGDDTYKRTLSNIKLLVDNGHNVRVRYNVNKKNKDIKQFLEELQSKEILDKVALSFVRTSNFENSSFINDFYIQSDEEYSGILLNIYKEMINYGLTVPKYTSLGTYCGYDNINSYLINTELELFYCSEEGEGLQSKIGDIVDGKEVLINDRKVRKLEYNPSNTDKCRKCKLIPLCKGGCQLLKNMDEDPCIVEKYFMNEYVKLIYEEEMRGMKCERA